MTAAASLRLALDDITGSFRKTNLWMPLGWYDFVLPYRQSVFGPFWEVAIMALWIGGLGFFFVNIFGRTDANYLAYLSVGLVLWNYMSTVLTNGARLFVLHADVILAVRNPLYTYVLRHFVRSVLRLGLHALVAAAVIVTIARPAHSDPLMAAAGLAVVLLTSIWVMTLFGVIGTRYRDINYLLSAIMRFLFFTTPVFWRASDLSERAFFAHLNPFTHFIEIVRAPLIGEPVWPGSWAVVLVFTTVGAAVTLALYAASRRRIPLWL